MAASPYGRDSIPKSAKSLGLSMKWIFSFDKQIAGSSPTGHVDAKSQSDQYRQAQIALLRRVANRLNQVPQTSAVGSHQ